MAKKAKTAQTARSCVPRMPEAKAVRLAEMIAYAPDSIVSRTLAENEAGTITLFAFAAGQGLSEHTAPFDAFVQVLDGQGEFIAGGKPSSVGAGEALLMPAGVRHAVKAGSPFKMLLTMLRSKQP
jgi:quercetin dioxygenase-like cupin family protein